MARNIKSNKESYYGYMRDGRKTGENVCPLWKETRDLVTEDMEMAKELN